MHRGYFDNDHFNSYYYSNIIDNVLSGNVEVIGFISSFKESYSSSVFRPFEKFSAFHCLIAHIVSEFFLEDMYEYDEKEFNTYLTSPPLGKLYAEVPLENYDLTYSFSSFVDDKIKITWEDIKEYHQELGMSGYLEELFNRIAHEVFYLLFNNRELLLRFNVIMSHYASDISLKELDDQEGKLLFNKDGVLKRVSIPEWVKRAVFFRDRGHCCNCKKDITKLTSLSEREQYDHIVPLIQGGLNDISNIQLLCADCNKKKGGKAVYTSTAYEKWY